MINFPDAEKKILKFWEEKKIFEKSLKKNEKGERFVFFEGPPTANGRPGIHHVLARAFKDVIPRFKTMQGYLVERKAGWDTHGLPVELEVEKELKISGKPEIEKYGLEKFNKKCQENVWKYKKDWEEMTRRLGFWVDLNDPYVTYDNNYIESVWWILKQVWDKKLLYLGHKVVPHCPRCGTALSSHEVAQGYQNIEEDSVYIKFELEDEPNTFVLAWTTTPWTLPGNVALALGPKIEYVKIKLGKEFYILAKDRLEIITDKYEIIEDLKAEDLEGKKYKPLFDFLDLEKETGKKAYYLALADFVTTEDGTGVVHTAVMYGEDDYNLGEKIGLPKIHTVDENGIFNHLVKPWQGRFVKDKKLEGEIIEYLKQKNLLYKTEKYTHDYPFCWRCDSPLLYYAKNSWFIKMSALRDELKKNNQQINWIPDYIKEGRFGEWINEVKDWAISRERYWGTPLPIWQCEKCGEYKCIGSRKDLFSKRENNITELIFVRHGESEKNVRKINSTHPDKYPLTDLGRKQAKKYAEELKKENIDLIITSPLLRTRQTAEIIQKELKVRMIENDFLIDVNEGAWDGKTHDDLLKNNPDYKKYWSDLENLVPGVLSYKHSQTGESFSDVGKKMSEFIKEVVKKYPGQKIVCVASMANIVMLSDYLSKLSAGQVISQLFGHKTGASPRRFYLKQDLKEVNLHRPEVDEIKLKCECGEEMKRVPEVIDCWFDSGSMPFSQWHYPFENKERIDQGLSYPADFISEAMDQTRGWFYTLLAISTLLGKGPAYKNVICLGLVLDKNGRKMSKSKGNIVLPDEIFEKYGADAIRWYFYTLNQPGETKNFDVKGVEEIVKKVFIVLMNVVTFYKMYAGEKIEEKEGPHILDKWIISKLNLLISAVTTDLGRFDPTSAARKIAEFINELSTWFLRRSRDRFKSEEAKDREEALGTLELVLKKIALLIAPFTPFLAEELYQNLKGEKESVHLEEWPAAQKIKEEAVLEDMALVRKIVEMGHSLRAENGLKVRQPLSQLVVRAKALEDDYLEILKDELNVKEIITGQNKEIKGKEFKTKEVGALKIWLDLTVTDELKEQGMVRETVRQINALRKKAGLTIEDRIKIFYFSEDEKIKGMFERYGKEFLSDTLAHSLDFAKEEQIKVLKAIKEFELEGKKVKIGFKK